MGARTQQRQAVQGRNLGLWRHHVSQACTSPKQLSSIDAKDPRASSSNESDGPTMSLRKACRAPAKHHLSSEAALAGEHASLQKSIGQKSLEERSHGMALNMQRQSKRQGRQSLPGRLRKKLAKEQGKGGGALCKRKEGHA